ncbi:MAG: hypothetical protein AAFU84_15785 [Cyanobacteria bacterium J06633_23]
MLTAALQAAVADSVETLSAAVLQSRTEESSEKIINDAARAEGEQDEQEQSKNESK